MATLGEILIAALRTKSSGIRVYPVLDLLMGAAPSDLPDRPAMLTMRVDDATVANLQGDPAQRSHYLMIAVPPEIWEASKSPIILPPGFRS